MGRSESGFDWRGESMSDAELEAFEDAAGDLGERVSEFLAEESESLRRRSRPTSKTSRCRTHSTTAPSTSSALVLTNTSALDGSSVG